MHRSDEFKITKLCVQESGLQIGSIADDLTSYIHSYLFKYVLTTNKKQHIKTSA